MAKVDYSTFRSPISRGINHYKDMDGNFIKLRYECPAKMRAHPDNPDDIDNGMIVVSMNKGVVSEYPFEGTFSEIDLFKLKESLGRCKTERFSARDASEYISNLLEVWDMEKEGDIHVA